MYGSSCQSIRAYICTLTSGTNREFKTQLYFICIVYKVFLPTSEAILHLLFQKVTDEILDGSIKVSVFKLAFVFQSATCHLFIMHLFFEIFKRQTGGHHFVDAAAHRPPVHRYAVVLLPQNLWSHVTSRTCLRTQTTKNTLQNEFL